MSSPRKPHLTDEPIAGPAAPGLPAMVAPDRSEILARLAEYRDAARGAYATATEDAFRSDSAVFAAWCTEAGLDALPATPTTVAAFIEAMSESRKAATIRRYVSTISHMHRAAGLPNPCTNPIVRFALKRMAKALTVRQQQARGINRSVLDRMLGAAGTTTRDIRNRALLAVAYDTLARRAELVALRIADFTEDSDGHGSIMIRRSKTDQIGEGSMRYVAPDTVQLVREWLTAAGSPEAGPLFRATRWNGATGGALSADDIGRLFKTMAAAAKLSPKVIQEISGHSTRVGAAQDMAAANVSMAGIMQSGGWKTPAMVSRYTAAQGARQSGAAQLAEKQGRTG